MGGGAAVDRAMDQLFDLAVVLGELMNRRLAGHGLTPARAEVLWVIHGTGPRTQRELSQVLKCTPRNVTGLVDALQAAGFVERTAHPTDRRATMVRLSEQGRSLIAGWTADREHGTAQVLGGIPADELTVFSAVLDRVLTQLRATYA
ncbi:MAG TPA: MarR family transcriptional regulator [Candidatus Limnocylindria bacterium]|nr:MarR family transcriptional regulator [Candidatus Limnocylindria bacterium]